jgi:tripartite-type tricarboxylate transporter receptor subunit TctC
MKQRQQSAGAPAVRGGRSILLQGIAITALLCVSSWAAAQSWPSKTVTILVPFPPGGAVDASARFLGEPLTKVLGESVVIENRAGAAGNIGYGVVARAPKDGHTLLMGYSATTACSPALYPNLGWDPVKDFAPVAMVAVSSLVLTVPSNSPANTLPEFLAYAKLHPGEINYGTSGVGSLAHIASEMIAQQGGVKMVHVPFKGTGDLMPSLLAGRIQLSLQGPPAVKQFVQNGRLKALAVTSAARDPIMPDVPTASESGLPGFAVEGWMGLFVPAGTPSATIAKLSDAVKRATEEPEVRQRAHTVGVDVRYLGPEAMAARVRKDIEDCRKTIRSANIRLE